MTNPPRTTPGAAWPPGGFVLGNLDEGKKKRLWIRSHGSTRSSTSRPPRCCELLPRPGSEVTAGHCPSPLPRRISKNIQPPRSEITGHDCHLRSMFGGTLAGVEQLMRWDDTGRGIRTVSQSVPVRLLSRAVRAEKR
ncbi:hypothetical protein BS329_18920 [Amycolatopsis coloradensis]|uniref:Uncharacterized protein n=1 Tax=Amycolatopsis coloradensis TaxID=76021 RepID=A0A1R0KRN0_9PSEU|nr:hypothetical protein BS329_18920 [Amycolatopsis coloradensis]